MQNIYTVLYVLHIIYCYLTAGIKYRFMKEKKIEDLEKSCALMTIKAITGKTDEEVIRRSLIFGYVPNEGMSTMRMYLILETFGYKAILKSSVTVGDICKMNGVFLCHIDNHGFCIDNGTLHRCGMPDITMDTPVLYFHRVEKSKDLENIPIIFRREIEDENNEPIYDEYE